MNALVSIIVPVYNVQEYVRRCLESLMNQSYENIEIIVIDDGSTDESGIICENCAKNDTRIKVFHKKNGGLSSARNYGIKRAKGKYICLVDSDDYVKIDFVKKMMDRVKTDNIDIVICGFNKTIPLNDESMSGRDTVRKLLLNQDNIEIIAWNKMYRSDLFNGLLYPEGKNYEDNLTTYKLLSKARVVSYLAESLYVYVEREGSITKNDKKEERLKNRELAANEAISYFKDDKDLCDAAKIALLTAKLAFLDSAISGEIDVSWKKRIIKWVKDNHRQLNKNKHLSKKLRLYLIMIDKWGGKVYILFRKIRHE